MGLRLSVPLSLPPLSPEESAHSEQLVQRIRDAIDAAGGWISFERFMEMALYEPGLGYYSAGSTKLGSEGDFVTAPEISPLFSRCLANQCVEVLETVTGGAILELGAGSGVMAADVLTELDRQQKTPESISDSRSQRRPARAATCVVTAPPAASDGSHRMAGSVAR